MTICRIIFLAIMMLGPLCGVLGAPAAGPSPRARVASTSQTVQLTLVRFENPEGLQLDVWVDGRRVGFTPTEARLPAGSHRLTVSAEMIVPVSSEFEVAARQKEQRMALHVMPLTRDNYEESGRHVVEQIIKHAHDPSMFLMALFLASDVDEGMEILRRADVVLKNDPVLETLRARVLMTAGEWDAAQEASDRALRRNPSLAYAWRVRSQLLLHQNQLAAALEAAEQAVKLESNSWLNYRTRADVHQRLENFREQNADSERATSMYRAMKDRADARVRERDAARAAAPSR